MIKTVLISGTSKGLGETIAKNFLKNNWAVIGISRSPASITDPNYTHYNADVSNYTELELILNNIPNIDILINNAAIFTMSDFEHTSIDQINTMLDINLKGPIFLTKLTIPKMLRDSKIIFINSVAGLNALENQSIYCASKHGLKAFANVLSKELQLKGIKVSSVHPGGINTTLWNSSNPYPLGDSNLALNPEEVSDLVYYISTHDNANYKEITLFPDAEWH